MMHVRVLVGMLEAAWLSREEARDGIRGSAKAQKLMGSDPMHGMCLSPGIQKALCHNARLASCTKAHTHCAHTHATCLGLWQSQLPAAG